MPPFVFMMSLWHLAVRADLVLFVLYGLQTPSLTPALHVQMFLYTVGITKCRQDILCCIIGHPPVSVGILGRQVTTILSQPVKVQSAEAAVHPESNGPMKLPQTYIDGVTIERMVPLVCTMKLLSRTAADVVGNAKRRQARMMQHVCPRAAACMWRY